MIKYAEYNAQSACCLGRPRKFDGWIFWTIVDVKRTKR